MRRADLRAVLPSPITVGIALVLAFGMVGNFDYADEIAREAEAKVLRPEIASQRTRIETSAAPRCPKQNAAGEWLRREVAANSDFKPWTYSCDYYTGAPL